MRSERVNLPGWVEIVALAAGVGALVGLVLPWYRGNVTGQVDHVELGLATAEGWGVAFGVLGAVGVVSWQRAKKLPGVGLTTIALALAVCAFAVAWIYGEQNADPVIVAGRRVEAGLGVGFYVSLVMSGVMVLALAGGVILGLVRKRP